MYRLAANYSLPLLELLAEGHVDVDYIKVPLAPYPQNLKQIRTAKQYRPLLLHLAEAKVLRLAAAQTAEAVNAQAVKEMVSLSATPYLSTHLDARLEDFPQLTRFRTATGSTPYHLMLGRFITHIYHLLEQIAPCRLLLENTVFSPWGSVYRQVVEPAFVRAAAEETGCGILLDIAHARCTAWHTGENIYAYLGRMPLERVEEIHISGLCWTDGEGWRDGHLPPEEEDYRILAWLLSRAPVRVVTLEYGGMSDWTTTPQGRRIFLGRNNKAWLREHLERLDNLRAKGCNNM